MHRRLCSLTLLLSLLVVTTGPVFAASTVVDYNSDDTTAANAVCVAVSKRETGSIEVTRIRITSSRNTTTSYTFYEKRSTKSLLETEALDGANCALPGCSVVANIDGVAFGAPVELRGLSLVLPPGARLFFATDADIGAYHQTLEVYYRQR